MPANYVLLATQTVGNGGAASVTFSNIPQSGYTDLKVVMSVRSTDDYLNVSFNGSSSNFTSRTLGANSGGAFSISASTGLAYGLSNSNSWTANTFSNAELYIPNYTSSNNKSFSVDAVTENNGTAITLALYAGLWSNTSAITSISFNQGSNTILAGSTFYLYGTAAVGTTPVTAPFASGGDVIANDGTYWYHAFKTTGAFVPAKALSADILTIAGGGSGGYTFNGGAGGGGAGGVFTATSQALSVSSYTCTIGAGGAGTITTSANGNDSQFGSLTLAKGGGAGGKQYGGSSDGAAGGSGGGGGGSGSAYAGGASTQTSTGGTGYGNAGGAGQSGTQNGGGGGGAGAAGANSTGSSGGAGGAGLNTWSSWATATATGASGYFAGGGGANTQSYGNASGGAGGGGTGGSNGTANTGGGGGGGPSNATVASGGSGIVIIRYAMV